MTCIKNILLITIFIMISACTSMPAHQGALNETISWQTRQKQLSTITNWNIQGAIAIRTQTKSISAFMNWSQKKHTYSISLFGPLDLGHTIIQGNPKLITLTTANNQKFTAKNPEVLIEQQLGWNLPVSNLFYWIRGLPVPNKIASKKFDAYHHLSQLTQDGWTITYLQYTSLNRTDLPSKIFLSRPQLRLKIIINRWS